MRPFLFERAGSPAAAVLAAAGRAEGDEEAQFLAGGTTLIDLMKLDVMRPEMVIDINALHRSRRQRPAARRAGPHGRRCRSSRCSPRLSGDRTVAVARSKRAASKHGESWWQRAPADPLHLFSRRLICRLQQAQSRVRLRRHERGQSHACGARNERSMHCYLSRGFRSSVDGSRCRRGDYWARRGA